MFILKKLNNLINADLVPILSFQDTIFMLGFGIHSNHKICKLTNSLKKVSTFCYVETNVLLSSCVYLLTA